MKKKNRNDFVLFLTQRNTFTDDWKLYLALVEFASEINPNPREKSPNRIVNNPLTDRGRWLSLPTQSTVEGFIYTLLYTSSLALFFLSRSLYSLYLSVSLSLSFSTFFYFLYINYSICLFVLHLTIFSQFDSIKQWLGCCLSKKM